MSEAPIEHIRVNANGLSFHVASCGAGERLALCLHGFPESSLAYEHQLPMFARLGYRAWAPDLRGYGASSRPRGIYNYRLAALLDDVAGLIDASGAKHVVLVGHDWGGGIAWAFAQRRVRPIDGLIVMNSAHPLGLLRGMTRPNQLLKLWYMFFFQLPWLPEFLLGRDGAAPIGASFQSASPSRPLSPDAIRTYRENATQPGALTAMINYYRAMMLSLFERDALRTTLIECPTLQVWGQADSVLLPAIAEDARGRAKDITIEYLPGVAHFVQQEAPEQVNAAIERWLGSRQMLGGSVGSKDNGSQCGAHHDFE